MPRSFITAMLLLAGCSHPQHTPPVTELGIAVPIAPGRTDAWRAALEDLTGPRRAEYAASRQRFGLTSQTTFLQRTPMGDFALIHLTGPDVHAAFHRMSSSRDAWDVKWRELTLDLHGVDFAKGERVLPKVVPAFAMDSGDGKGTPFMFLAPLGAGGADRMRAIARTVMGDQHADYVRSRERAGIHREAVFLESTAMGDAVVVYWLADDPPAALRALAASNDPIPLASIVDIASGNAKIADYQGVTTSAAGPSPHRRNR